MTRVTPAVTPHAALDPVNSRAASESAAETESGGEGAGIAYGRNFRFRAGLPVTLE